MNFSILCLGGGPLRCHIYGTIQVAIKQDGRFVCLSYIHRAKKLQCCKNLCTSYAFQCLEYLILLVLIITVHFSLLIDSIFNYAISSSRQHSVEWHDDKQIMKWKEYMCSWCLINPLGPESNAQGTLQKTQDVNDHPLFCMYLANNFSGCWFSLHQYVDYILLVVSHS